MDKKFYLSYLDELTDRELRIWFYRDVLKLSAEDIARRTKTTIKETKKTIKMLHEQRELLFIKADLIEHYNLVQAGVL